MTQVTVRTEADKNKTSKALFMPLPPPPFTLANRRNRAAATTTRATADESTLHNNTYLVDSGLGNLNRVTLLRSNDDRSASKVATRPVALPTVSLGGSPETTPKPKRKASAFMMSSSSSESSSSSSSHATTTLSIKKPRKKWLPALGPPEAESLRILARTASHGSWYCENPESFSTLSALSKQ